MNMASGYTVSFYTMHMSVYCISEQLKRRENILPAVMYEEVYFVLLSHDTLLLDKWGLF